MFSVEKDGKLGLPGRALDFYGEELASCKFLCTLFYGKPILFAVLLVLLLLPTQCRTNIWLYVWILQEHFPFTFRQSTFVKNFNTPVRHGICVNKFGCGGAVWPTSSTAELTWHNTNKMTIKRTRPVLFIGDEVIEYGWLSLVWGAVISAVPLLLTVYTWFHGLVMVDDRHVPGIADTFNTDPADVWTCHSPVEGNFLEEEWRNGYFGAPQA